MRKLVASGNPGEGTLHVSVNQVAGDGPDSKERADPVGPFFSNYGPRDGPILYGGAPVMGVLDGQGEVVGVAWLAGAIPSRRGPVQLFRLEVRKVWIEGAWICRCRRFVRLGGEKRGQEPILTFALRLDRLISWDGHSVPPKAAFSITR